MGVPRVLSRGAANAAGEWIASMREWDLYVTLTYDPKRVAGRAPTSAVDAVAPSAYASRRHVDQWAEDGARIVRSRFGAVLALEHHHSGWPHWHGLVSADGIGKLGFTGLSRAWFANHGFASFVRVADQPYEALAGYIGKYLAKEASDLAFYGTLRRHLPGHFE